MAFTEPAYAPFAVTFPYAGARRINKEWNLAAGVYPATPEDRSIYLECLWDGVREQLAEAKRRA